MNIKKTICMHLILFASANLHCYTATAQVQAFNLSHMNLVIWGVPADIPPAIIAELPAGVAAQLNWPDKLVGFWIFDTTKAPDVRAILQRNKGNVTAALTEFTHTSEALKNKYPNSIKYFDISHGSLLGGSITYKAVLGGQTVTQITGTSSLLIGPNLEFSVYTKPSAMPDPTGKMNTLRDFVCQIFSHYGPANKSAFFHEVKSVQTILGMHKTEWPGAVNELGWMVYGIKHNGVLPQENGTTNIRDGSFPTTCDRLKQFMYATSNSYLSRTAPPAITD